MTTHGNVLLTVTCTMNREQSMAWLFIKILKLPRSWPPSLGRIQGRIIQTVSQSKTWMYLSIMAWYNEYLTGDTNLGDFISLICPHRSTLYKVCTQTGIDELSTSINALIGYVLPLQRLIHMFSLINVSCGVSQTFDTRTLSCVHPDPNSVFRGCHWLDEVFWTDHSACFPFLQYPSVLSRGFERLLPGCAWMEADCTVYTLCSKEVHSDSQRVWENTNQQNRINTCMFIQSLHIMGLNKEYPYNYERLINSDIIPALLSTETRPSCISKKSFYTIQTYLNMLEPYPLFPLHSA